MLDSVYHLFDSWQEDYYVVFGHPYRQKQLGFGLAVGLNILLVAFIFAGIRANIYFILGLFLLSVYSTYSFLTNYKIYTTYSNEVDSKQIPVVSHQIKQWEPSIIGAILFSFFSPIQILLPSLILSDSDDALTKSVIFALLSLVDLTIYSIYHLFLQRESDKLKISYLIAAENDKLMMRHIDPEKFEKKAIPIEEYREMFGFPSITKAIKTPKTPSISSRISPNEYPDLNRSIGNSIADTLHSVSPIKSPSTSFSSTPSSTRSKKRNPFQSS